MTDEQVPPRGWHVRIETADGTIRRPDVVDDPEWSPSIRSKPVAEIPVPRDQTWLDERYDRADAAVWLDGERLPIDRLDDVAETPDQTILECSGGKQLDSRARRDVENENIHDVAEDLVETNTSYETAVDEPDTEPIEDQILQDADDNQGFEAVFGADIDDQMPVEIDDDELAQLQTSWLRTHSDFGDTFDSLDDSDAVEGTAVNMTGSAERATTSVTIPHDIPAEHLRVGLHGREGSDVELDADPEVTVEFDPATDSEFEVLVTNPFAFPSGDYEWVDQTGRSSVPDPVEAGSYSVDVFVDDVSDDDPEEGMIFDGLAVVDDRWDHSLDDPTGDPLEFDRPGPYAQNIQITGETRVTPLGIDEATVALDTTGTENGQAIAISQDAGETFDERSNSDAETWGFDPPADSLTVRLTLSGHGSQTESPRERPDPQIIDVYALTVDIANIARAINEAYDGDLVAVLADLADEAGAIWDIQYDEAAETMELNWTMPGQREAGGSLEPTAYQVERDASDIVEAATVVGSRRTRSEEVTVDSVGAAVALDRERIIAGTEEVVSAADGTDYEPAIDYNLRPNAGEIVATSGGDIDAGETLELEYDYKVAGRHESDAWTDDPATDARATIPGLSSSSACEQAAIQLVRRASEPRLEASVDLASLDPSQSVIEAVDVDILPEDMGPWDVREIIRDPAAPTLSLGAGTNIDEQIQLIQRGIGSLEERT